MRDRLVHLAEPVLQHAQGEMREQVALVQRDCVPVALLRLGVAPLVDQHLAEEHAGLLELAVHLDRLPQRRLCRLQVAPLVEELARAVALAEVGGGGVAAAAAAAEPAALRQLDRRRQPPRIVERHRRRLRIACHRVGRPLLVVRRRARPLRRALRGVARRARAGDAGTARRLARRAALTASRRVAPAHWEAAGGLGERAEPGDGTLGRRRDGVGADVRVGPALRAPRPLRLHRRALR